MTLTTRPSPVVHEGERWARISLQLLWWAPLSAVVGFVAASWFLSESWPLWQVLPLASILAAPFAAGAYYGVRAVRAGVRQGWFGLIPHLLLVVTALVMPLMEALA
ncbi:MAG TPA: hypothetical protein VFO17_09645 [Acidimicrobiia bacterium]|jgi:hypothetical protein|nr:hypothetical protein [Acidimicrobiia bacterium]